MTSSWVDYIRLIPTAPGAELVLGLVLFAIALATAKFRGHAAATSTTGQGRPSSTVTVSRIAAASSILVLLGWLAGDIAVIAIGHIVWWRYAAPLVGVCVGLGLLLVVVVRRSSRVEVAVPPTLRRTWRTFSSGREIVAALAVVGAVGLVTVCAGLASSPDAAGNWDQIDLPGQGSASFFGWRYGLPLLITAGAVIVLAAIALHRDSTRPYTRPDVVTAQIDLRRATASAVLRPVIGASTLCLGAIFMFVGETGMARVGTDIDGVGTVMWGTGFSAFGPVLFWMGWGLEVASVVALLATVAASRRPNAARAARVTARTTR